MTYNIQLLVHCAALHFDVDMANALTAGCITDMEVIFCQHEPLMSDRLPDCLPQDLLLLGCTCKA